MIKLKCKKIREMIKDELKGAREYKKYGLKKLSSDENKHYKFLKKLEKKVCK